MVSLQPRIGLLRALAATYVCACVFVCVGAGVAATHEALGNSNATGPRTKLVTRHILPTFAKRVPWAAAAVTLSENASTAVTLEVDEDTGEVVRFGDGPDGALGNAVVPYGEVPHSSPRRLQTTCTPGNPANGVYSGSPPSLTDCIFGGSSLNSDATWTLTCNTGYYLVGSPWATCRGTKTCWYSSTINQCFSTCWWSGPCYWCCTCSNSYTFFAASGWCAQCVPPTAPNANNPSTQNGQVTYSWTCADGFYGASVSRSCTSSGTWTNSPISCTACNWPSLPANGAFATVSTTERQYSCSAGYYTASGTFTTLRCSNTNGVTVSPPSCIACGGNGFWCNGQARLQCRGGYFGLAGATLLSTDTCSGMCTEGYFCTPGSTSSTQNPCGSIDRYCPAGSAQPVVVPSGWFSTPTSASPALRTGIQACPAFRSCSDGVILPGVTFPTDCASGSMSVTVPESFSFFAFGPTLVPSTPGYSGTLTWTVSSVASADSTCVLATSNFTFVTTTTSGRLQVGSWPLDYPGCPNGFTLNIRVARSNDASLFATCAVAVEVTQVAKRPIITDCASRAVAERTVLGTVVGTPLMAINRNIGTSLLWYINATGFPFSVGLCDGQVRVLRTLSWSAQQTYRIPIMVRNDGSSLGIGSSDAGCTLTVNVTMVALPPVPLVTSFFLPELSPVGTRVGNVAAADPSNFTVTNHTWGAVDSPNAFAIDRWGNITVSTVVDTLVSLKSVFNYRVNISNAFVMSSTPISITLVPVPRPPVVADQSRTVLENAVPGTTLSPALTASHPQNLNFTFAVVPNNTFSITRNGLVLVAPGVSMDFNIQNVYTLSIIVTDTNGQSTTATLTVTLIEVNKRPSFCCGAFFDYTIDEYSGAGAAVIGAQSIFASDPNTRDSLIFRVLSASPSRASALFSLDPITGAVTVGLGVVATGGVLMFDQSLVYPAPQTFILNISVSDNGAPQLSANGTVRIRMTNIRPRITFTPRNSGQYIIPGNATIGLRVADFANVTWTPYSNAIHYSISTELTARGDMPFVVDESTGVLTVSNNTYWDVNNTWGPPRWDFNTKNVFVVNVTATDTITQQFALASARVMLSHINRPPVWRPIPIFFAAALTSGNVGSPLGTFVDDPDVPLNVGETFNFTLVGGNANNTFAIDGATGQIFVLNNATQAFQSRGGVGVFNLTVSVIDAGINGPRFTARSFVLVNVTDSNRAPTLGFANFSVNELVPLNTVVGRYWGTDLDAWQTLNYTISPAGPNLNRPFPFSVRNVAGGPQGACEIFVIDDGPVDWNNAFKMYFATITATDSHPSMPLSSSTQITIFVNWVPRPPFFHPSGAAAAATFTFAIPQHAPSGTNVSTAPVLARSKDPWRIPNLRYSWVSPGSLSSLFTIDPVTAAITVAAGNPSISVYAAQSYTLTVRVMDDNSPQLSDTATVTINILETNDPAVWTGTFTPAWVPTSTLTVREDAPVGTVIGFVNATDPNWTPMWRARNFGLVQSDSDARFFAMNATTGAITVGATGLDFWDQTTFTITATCTDNDPFNPITVYRTVAISLIQVNTVRVLAFVVPPTLSADSAVNVSGSVYEGLPQFSGTDVLVRTSGLSTQDGIWIIGSGFGRTARRLAAEGASAASTNVTAVFGPAMRYTASCSVFVPNTVIRCGIPAGAGAGHSWRIYVDGWLVAPATRTSYIPPTIMAVTKAGGDAMDNSTQTLSTRGGEAVIVDGINFGPADLMSLQLAYGPVTGALSYISPACFMVTAHTRIRCDTTPGVGANLAWRTTVSSQMSPLFTSSGVRYATPSITVVRAPMLMSDGNEANAIQINGTDFGPVNTPGIVVQYSADFADASIPVWTALNCEVSAANPHATVQCTSAAGVGRNLRVRITVGGQTSSSSADTLAYIPPTIQNIGGLGADNADTIGGQQIVISGFNFGPVTPVDEGGFPIPGYLQPVAQYGRFNATAAALGLPLRYAAAGCRVAVAHRQILCNTVEGTGSSLVWQVFVGGQTVGPFFNRTTSYHPPIVASYAGAGSANAETFGGQIVVIDGKNFGPAGTLIDRATYGSDVNGSTFEAWNCTLLRAHTAVQCFTAVGAGAGLSWFVTIDGQRSVAPSTGYGVPIVQGFAGAAADANTDGGDTVVLRGRFFSVDRWLNRVTYGPSGTEFAATNCRLSQNHTEISCVLRPGTGRVLQWLVTVGGQTSSLSTQTTSYAPPAVTSITPGNGSTPGGLEVNITGTNFALLYAAAQVTVKINNLNVNRPSAAALSAHWTSLYAGSTGSSAVAQWVDSLTTLRPTATRAHGGGVHSVRVIIPEGFGPAAEVFVMVNGIPSNIVTFRYNAPIITNIAPDRQNVSLGYLRVFVQGSSFCSSGACGNITVNGGPVELRSWDHREILFVMPDPSSSDSPSLAQVWVAGVGSNVFPFKKPVPNINNLVTQATWTRMDTRGGEQFYALGVMDIGLEPVSVWIGGRECTNVTRQVDNGMAPTDFGASFTLRCTTPAGVGLANSIIIVSTGGASRMDGSFVFDYAPPSLLDITLLAGSSGSAVVRRLALTNGVPTLGANVSITGLNLGSPTISWGIASMDNAISLAMVSQTDTEVVVTIPPGDGTGHFITYTVGGQTSPPIFFSYTPPTVTGITPASGPTVGGSLVAVTGYNLGVSQPIVLIGGRNCSILQPFVPAPGHDLVRCRIPFGQGKDLPVMLTVSGQTSSGSTPALFTYNRPQVFSLAPPSGPTSGRVLGRLLSDGIHRDIGDRIPVTLFGSNLGLSGTLELRTHVGTDPLAVNVPVPAADVISWNDTVVQFFMPAGYGDSLYVYVLVSGQDNEEVLEFRYDPPSVVAIARDGRTISECMARPLCFTYVVTPPEQNETTIEKCKLIPAGCYSTAGGYAMEIIGQSFGRLGARVTVGGKDCPILSQDHGRITCSVPRGLGDSNAVIVRVGSRPSLVNNATLFAYDPPLVQSTMPNTPNAQGDDVTFQGKNFGFDRTDVSITVSGKVCEGAEWLNDARLKCRSVEDVVGPKNISILVANRTTPYEFFEMENMFVSECIPGFYGLDGEFCTRCPQGARCPGREHTWDRTTSLPGFWKLNLTTSASSPAGLCDFEPATKRTLCPYFAPCEPAQSCNGSNTCAEGYTDVRCSQCVRGQYYRVNGECVKCPDSPWAIIVVMALALVAMVLIAYMLNKKNVSIALISIGVDYFQVVSMFARTKIRWPPLVKQLFQIMSAFNLNLELTAPECLMPTLAFWQKWFFIEALPLFAIFMFLIVHMIKVGYKACCLNKKKDQLMSHFPTLVSTCIVIFRVLYLYLTRTSLDVMNCSPTDPPDGNFYMNGMLDVVCWQPGSQQVFLFPFALLTLGTYSAALPIAVLLFMRRHRDAIKYDQILRAKGLGDDRLTNPKFYAFRKMWSKLYYHYKPGKWYWELVITARKAAIAVTSLMFRNTPSYQLSVSLLVVFAAFVLHMRHLPYLTHTDKPKVLEEHMSKVTTDPLHATIEADMRAVEKKNNRKRTRAAAFVVEPKSTSLVGLGVLYVFDYNTVEAILLGCCILINLSGIMFDSNRFKGDLAAIYTQEYNVLAAFAVALILISVIYYITVVVLDLTVVCCPTQAGPCIASLSCRRALPTRKGATKLAVGTVAAAPGDDGVDSGPSMQVNPFMLRQASASSVPGGDEDVPLGAQGILDPSAMESVNVPNPAMWRAVKEGYGRMHVMIEELSRQLKDSKQAAEMIATASSAQSGKAVSTGARRKQEFTPVAAHETQDEAATVAGNSAFTRVRAAGGQSPASRAALLSKGFGSSAALSSKRSFGGGAKASPVSASASASGSRRGLLHASDAYTPNPLDVLATSE